MNKNSWHKIELTQNQHLENVHLELKRRFVCNMHNIGKDGAIYSTEDDCTLYFTPSSNRYFQALVEDAVDSFGALPSDPPEGGVHLFASHPEFDAFPKLNDSKM